MEVELSQGISSKRCGSQLSVVLSIEHYWGISQSPSCNAWHQVCELRPANAESTMCRREDVIPVALKSDMWLSRFWPHRGPVMLLYHLMIFFTLEQEWVFLIPIGRVYLRARKLLFFYFYKHIDVNSLPWISDGPWTSHWIPERLKALDCLGGINIALWREWTTPSRSNML